MTTRRPYHHTSLALINHRLQECLWRRCWSCLENTFSSTAASMATTRCWRLWEKTSRRSSRIWILYMPCWLSHTKISTPRHSGTVSSYPPAAMLCSIKLGLESKQHFFPKGDYPRARFLYRPRYLLWYILQSAASGKTFAFKYWPLSLSRRVHAFVVQVEQFEEAKSLRKMLCITLCKDIKHLVTM